jgi:hypothetical protein
MQENFELMAERKKIPSKNIVLASSRCDKCKKPEPEILMKVYQEVGRKNITIFDGKVTW